MVRHMSSQVCFMYNIDRHEESDIVKYIGRSKIYGPDLNSRAGV